MATFVIIALRVQLLQAHLDFRVLWFPTNIGEYTGKQLSRFCRCRKAYCGVLKFYDISQPRQKIADFIKIKWKSVEPCCKNTIRDTTLNLKYKDAALYFDNNFNNRCFIRVSVKNIQLMYVLHVQLSCKSMIFVGR